MHITFKEIHIENFMSIGSANISLTDRGFTLVEGINNNKEDNARSNGSGKSSLFEALVWCLTGTTVRGNKNIVNYNGTDGACVRLFFDVGSDAFELIRAKDHSKYKTNLHIIINGEDKSGKGIRDSEKLLSEYLPELTASLIGSVIVLGQGLPQKFSANTPSGRKEVLEKLCKSDFMIQDLKDRISNRKDFLNKELRAAEDSILSTNTQTKMNNEALEKYRNKLDTLTNAPDYETILSDLNAQLSGIHVSKESLEQSISANDSRINELESIKKDDYDAEKSMSDSIRTEHSEKIDALYKHKNEISIHKMSLEKELQRLRSITDVCPTCGQKLPNMEKPDTSSIERELITATTTYNEAETQYAAAVKAMNDALNLVSQTHTQNRAKINEELTELSARRSETKVSLIELNTKESNIEKDIAKITNEKENLESNIHECRCNVFEIEQCLLDLRAKLIDFNTTKLDIENRLSIISKFNTIVSRDFRGYLLCGIIEYINRRAKDYCKDIFETELIEFSLEGNNLNISYNGKEYEALSGGERQKIDLILQFAIRDMLCSHTSFSSNIIVMDEIFDNLDDIGCQKIIQLIATKLSDISTIFIITHHSNELNIPYDNVIKLEKNDDGITRLCS